MQILENNAPTTNPVAEHAAGIEGGYVTNENTVNRVHEEYEWKMQEFITDPDIRELIAAIADDRGLEIADMSDPDLSEDDFMSAAQLVLDSRKGQGREAIVNVPYSERAQAALDAVKEKLNMNHNSEPSRRDFDIALIPGSAGKSPHNRLEYMCKQIESGVINTDTIVMLGSERPMNMKPLKDGTTELDRAGESGYDMAGNPAETEFDLLRNAAAHKFDIQDNEWHIVSGYDSSIPETHHYQHGYKIAYAEKDGKKLFVVSAPMIGDERIYPDGNRRNRSNTGDTVAMVARMLQDYAPDGRELNAVVSTDAVFAPFQNADFASMMAEAGVRVDTIGFSREEAGAKDWPGGSNFYAQELLSAIRQARAARDTLSAQAEESRRIHAYNIASA